MVYVVRYVSCDGIAVKAFKKRKSANDSLVKWKKRGMNRRGSVTETSLIG